MVEQQQTNQSSGFPARIANLLEQIAARIRETTVDRVAVYLTWMAIAIVVAGAIFMVVLWLLVSLFRALGELIGQEAAYAVVGGILVLVGAFLWWKRWPKDETAPPEAEAP
jgi:membrane associated rhomboid family serine protease